MHTYTHTHTHSLSHSKTQTPTRTHIQMRVIFFIMTLYLCFAVIGNGLFGGKFHRCTGALIILYCVRIFSYIFLYKCVHENRCMCVTCQGHTWETTRSYLRHDSPITHMYDVIFIHAHVLTRLTYMWDMIRMWDLTHPHAYHDSFTCVTWLIWMFIADSALCIHTCDMHPSYVCHDSFTRLPWLNHFVWHDSFMGYIVLQCVACNALQCEMCCSEL